MSKNTKKFTKVSVRGTFDTDTLGDYAKTFTQGAGAGAAAGGIMGGVGGPAGVLGGAGVGALIGGVGDVAVRGIEDVFYALKSPEQKIAWLAGDLLELIEKEISPRLSKFNPKYAQELELIADQFKEFADLGIRDKFQDTSKLNNNLFYRLVSNPNMVNVPSNQTPVESYNPQDIQTIQIEDDKIQKAEEAINSQLGASKKNKFTKLANYYNPNPLTDPAMPLYFVNDAVWGNRAYENVAENATKKLMDSKKAISILNSYADPIKDIGNISYKLGLSKSPLTLEQIARYYTEKSLTGKNYSEDTFNKIFDSYLKGMKGSLSRMPNALDRSRSGLITTTKELSEISSIRNNLAKNILKGTIDNVSSGNMSADVGYKLLVKHGVNIPANDFEILLKNSGKITEDVLDKLIVKNVKQIANPSTLTKGLMHGVAGLGLGIAGSYAGNKLYDAAADITGGGLKPMLLKSIQSGENILRAIISISESLPDNLKNSTNTSATKLYYILNQIQASLSNAQGNQINGKVQ